MPAVSGFVEPEQLPVYRVRRRLDGHMRAIDKSRHMTVNWMTVLVEFPSAFKSIRERIPQVSPLSAPVNDGGK